MRLEGLNIVFLGDSITEGSGTTGAEQRFANRIAAQYGAIVHCDGISGTRIARQQKPYPNPRCDRDFPSRVAELPPDADVVVVFGGTNDYGHGDAQFGCFADRTVDTFCGALHVLYSALLTKYPYAAIVVLTPLHRINEDIPNIHGRVLREYVEIIRTTAEYYSLPVLDLYATYGVQPTVPVMRETYMPDGLHPNDAGHVLLTQKIAQFIMNL